MPKRNGKRPLVRDDEPSQTTETGLEIPIPERGDVMDLFDRVARKRKPKSDTPKRSRKRKAR